MTEFVFGPYRLEVAVEATRAWYDRYGDATGGVRDNTESHLKLIEEHGWNKYFPVDLLDAQGPDVVWPIPHGKILKENHLGKYILHYDSMLVLAHFKGHPMGGYGGALKQLAIGCASSYGKAYVHGAGDPEKIWTSDHDSFLESNDLSCSHYCHAFQGIGLSFSYCVNFRDHAREDASSSLNLYTWLDDILYRSDSYRLTWLRDVE